MGGSQATSAPALTATVLRHRSTAVVEWLLSRDSQPGAARALIVPSIRALHLSRSKLGCHAALSKAGLPTLRTAAVLSPAGAADAAETLCGATGSCFVVREDCGGRQLTVEAGDGGRPGALRGSAQLLQALGAADPPPRYPIVLQECPDYSVYSRVRLLYVDHKLESVVGLVGGAAGEDGRRQRHGASHHLLLLLLHFLRCDVHPVPPWVLEPVRGTRRFGTKRTKSVAQSEETRVAAVRPQLPPYERRYREAETCG